MAYKVGTTKFAEASDTKTMFIVIATVILVVLVVVAILGIVGICKESACMLITYAIIVLVFFVGFWLLFMYMKGGKGTCPH